LLVFAASAMMLACDDSRVATGPSVTPPPDTTTLAGKWVGTVDGTGGHSTLTTILNADSTMSGEGTTTFYCKITGTWTVAGGRYTATGRTCDGTIVTSVAPFNKLRLTGTWSGLNGSSGTFTVAKQ